MDSGEDALKDISEKVQRRQRLEDLETELGVLQQEAPTAHAADRTERLQELELRLSIASQTNPVLFDVPLDRSAGRYLDESHVIQRHRDEQQRRRSELRERVGRILDDYRKRMPQLLDDTDSLERRLKQTKQYRDALVLAAKTLAEVAQEAHKTWATALNACASVDLRRLAPNYPEMRFDDQLEIRVLDRDGKPWAPTDGQLSRGVCDRIYLAARSAIADCCSPEDDPLPLILDDPLVNSDDAHFDAVMTYFLEHISLKHQLLVLSCHKRRHDGFIDREQELWTRRGAVLRLD